MTGWKKGFPPGGLQHGWVNDWDMHFGVFGGIWHRRRTEAEKAAVTYIHNADGTVSISRSPEARAA